MGIVGIVSFSLTFGSLMFRSEMPAAGFIPVERIGAHHFRKLEEVGYSAGFFERHIELLVDSEDIHVLPEFFANLRDPLQRFFETRLVARHTAMFPHQKTKLAMERVNRL
jgi:hypothetical protein